MKRTMILWLVCLCLALCLILPSCGAQPVNTNISGALTSNSEKSVEGKDNSENASGTETIFTTISNSNSEKITTTNTTAATNSSEKTTILTETISTYPITSLKGKHSGSSINFSVGASMPALNSRDERWFDVFVVKTYQQLHSVFEGDNNSGNYNYIQKYTQTFFDQNALIVLFITKNGSVTNLTDRFDSVIVENKKLYINRTTFSSSGEMSGGASSDVLSPFWVILEVKKSDVENINEICSYTQTESR